MYTWIVLVVSALAAVLRMVFGRSKGRRAPIQFDRPKASRSRTKSVPQKSTRKNTETDSVQPVSLLRLARETAEPATAQWAGTAAADHVAVKALSRIAQLPRLLEMAAVFQRHGRRFRRADAAGSGRAANSCGGHVFWQRHVCLGNDAAGVSVPAGPGRYLDQRFSGKHGRTAETEPNRSTALILVRGSFRISNSRPYLRMVRGPSKRTGP